MCKRNQNSPRKKPKNQGKKIINIKINQPWPDFLYRNWKVRNQAKVDLFLYLLFFFPGFLVFFWVSFDYSYTSICGRSDLMECLGGKVRIQRAMDTTWMPVMWPLKSCMPIGAFLLLVQGISEVLKSYYAFVKGRWP